jgi:hypothetical protein
MSTGRDDETAVASVNGESVDLVAITEELLKKASLPIERRGDDLCIASAGLVFSPRFLEASGEGGQWRSVTIVRTRHPAAFPSGMFEYQHGRGTDLRGSIQSGLEDWSLVDMPVLVDALFPKPAKCSELRLTLPPGADGKSVVRRILLGPVRFFSEKAHSDKGKQHPPFCRCCLMTNSLKTFMPHIQAPDTRGVRLYAARGKDGDVMADCRVNGEDFDGGKAALVAYARTWRDLGIEFRKQYAVIQTCEGV